VPFNKLVVVPKLVEDLDQEKRRSKKEEEDCDSSSLDGKVRADEAGKNGRAPLGVPDIVNKEDEHQKAIDAVDTDDRMSTDPKVLAKGIAVVTEADKDLKRVYHQVSVLCSEQTCPMQA